MLCLPLEIIREIGKLLDPESVSALVVAIAGVSRPYAIAAAKRPKLQVSSYSELLPVLRLILPLSQLHLHPQVLADQSWNDLQYLGLGDESIALTISKFAWPKIHPSVYPQITKVELIDGFFDKCGWNGRVLPHLTTVELHGMRIKGKVHLPSSLILLTMVDCFILGHSLDLGTTQLRKVELYRGEGLLVLPPTVTSLINGRMWVVFALLPLDLTKLNDWTETRRDVIGKLVTANWKNLTDLLISLTWKLPPELSPHLRTLESAQDELPINWLPQLSTLGVDVRFFYNHPNVWHQGKLNLSLDSRISHLRALTLFVNDPGIRIVGVPESIEMLWIEGEEDCDVEELVVASPSLKLCTVYFCRKVVIDCPRLSDIELSYCNGALPASVKLPLVITDLSIDASDQIDRVVVSRHFLGKSFKFVGCHFSDCTFRGQEIHLDGCKFVGCRISSCHTLELNISELGFAEILHQFVNSTLHSRFSLDRKQLMRLLPSSIRHLEFRNPILEDVIVGNEFSHLTQLNHLTLGCQWTGCLQVPLLVVEIIFEDVYFRRLGPAMAMGHVQLVAFKNCHFKGLLYQDLGSPPDLRWVFIAKCTELCCADAMVDYSLFPVGCRIVETRGINPKRTFL